MNRSRRQIWDIVKKLYIEEKMQPSDILADIKGRQYFDPSIIPTIGSIYDYLSRTGISTARLKEKRLEQARKQELIELKARLKKRRFEVAKQQILDGLNNGDFSIDDLTRDNIGRLQALLVDLTSKIGDAKSDEDKISAVKLLDRVVQTLLKARILEDRPSGKTEVSGEISLADKILNKYDKKEDSESEGV